MTMQWFIKTSDFYPVLPTPTSPGTTPLKTGYIVDPRAVGLFSQGKIIFGGRHQQDVEVWSCPTSLDLVDGKVVKEDEEGDWRKRSMLLCSSTQMALCLPAPGFGPVVEKEKSKL